MSNSHYLHVRQLDTHYPMLLSDARRLAGDQIAIDQMQAEIDDAASWLMYVDQSRLDRINNMRRSRRYTEDWEYLQEVDCTKRVVKNYTRILADIEASRTGITKDFLGNALCLSDLVVYPRSAYGGSAFGVGYVTAINPNGGVQIRPAKKQDDGYVPSNEKLITLKGDVLKVTL